FFAKTFFWIFFVMWIRWTLPRFRYDQLMSLGWRVMLPLALAYIVVIAGAIWALDAVFPTITTTARAGALFLLNIPLGWGVFFFLDRGRIVRGVAQQRVPLRAGAEG